MWNRGLKSVTISTMLFSLLYITCLTAAASDGPVYEISWLELQHLHWDVFLRCLFRSASMGQCACNNYRCIVFAACFLAEWDLMWALYRRSISPAALVFGISRILGYILLRISLMFYGSIMCIVVNNSRRTAHFVSAFLLDASVCGLSPDIRPPTHA